MQILKLGSTGLEVRMIQKRLNITEDGVFGPKTEEAVKKFQKTYNLKVDGIVGKITWNKMFSNKRDIKEIIIHCSATPEGKNFTVADIKKWHLARGFSDIGYHYVIYLDGSINKGRDESKVGAHCEGHNSNSIGVCYIGGLTIDGIKPKDTRTEAQKKSLISLLKELKCKYPQAKIYPHYKYANKACPCFDAEKEYKSL